MKYKYSRKLLAKAYGGYDYEKDFLEDLLATKPEKEHNEDKLGKSYKKEEHNYAWFLAGNNCEKCLALNPTPSPLEEIEEVEAIFLPLTDAVENKINQLIRNQKKIISYLKKR